MPEPDTVSRIQIASAVLWLLVLWPAQPLPATPGPPASGGDWELCDRAARNAARLEGVPADVLLAVARTESGRRQAGDLTPWPWTVNMEGVGNWFDTPEAAKSYVFSHFKDGARSFDVGCFQINYRWHGHAFRSLEEMFRPEENARYAAAFLRQLRDELGSWDAAVGAYHSRTPELARRYVARYLQVLSELPDAATPVLPASLLADRPAFIAGRGRPGAELPQGLRLGSLFPAGGDRAPLFVGASQ